MAQTANQDEDLLIITESDDDSNGDEILFSFDDDSATSSEKIENKEASVKEESSSAVESDIASEISATDITQDDTAEVISTQELTDSQEEVTAKPETTTQPEATSDNKEEENNDAFTFDLISKDDVEDSKTVKAADIPVTDTSSSEETSDTNDLFGTGDVIQETETAEKDIKQDVAPAKVEEIEVKQEEESQESLNDILSATISKLQKRKEAIAADTSSKTAKEEDIKSQIKKLEEEVSRLEAEMKTLGEESDKITSNIKELEGMKLDPVKDYNAKRTTKK